MTTTEKYAMDMKVGDYFPYGLQDIEITAIDKVDDERLRFTGVAQRAGRPVEVSEIVHPEALVFTQVFGSGTTYRRFRSSSTYVDDFEHQRVFGLDIPDLIDAEDLDELLQPESGAGHFAPDGEAVDAYYEIESIDGVEPCIHWEATG